MYEEEAGKALAAVGLKYEVLDYKYDKMMVEGGVIEQKPEPGAYVKDGRKIYLTLNSGKEPVRAVPDLADNSSLRAAESRLRSAGFKLARTVYIDGDLDWVYEIRYQGKEIEAGTEIPEGSTLTIVAGNGNPVQRIEEVDSTLVIDTDFFE
jgi:beta-lactam-binding protein with PASTA domain